MIKENTVLVHIVLADWNPRDCIYDYLIPRPGVYLSHTYSVMLLRRLSLMNNQINPNQTFGTDDFSAFDNCSFLFLAHWMPPFVKWLGTRYHRREYKYPKEKEPGGRRERRDIRGSAKGLILAWMIQHQIFLAPPPTSSLGWV